MCRLISGDRGVALSPGENLLGRDEAAVVWMDDARIWRRRARIVIDESGAELEDLKSRNGTMCAEKESKPPGSSPTKTE